MAVGGAKTRYFLLFLDLNPLSRCYPARCAMEEEAAQAAWADAQAVCMEVEDAEGAPG